MRVIIKGQFYNGQPYEGITPKESLTDEAAAELLENIQDVFDEIQATSDGSQLDKSTLTAELYDDFHYPRVKMAALNEALYELQVLDQVKAAIASASPAIQIWYKDADEVNMLSPKVADLVAALGYTEAFKRRIFRRAYEIQVENSGGQ